MCPNVPGHNDQLLAREDRPEACRPACAPAGLGFLLFGKLMKCSETSTISQTVVFFSSTLFCKMSVQMFVCIWVCVMCQSLLASRHNSRNGRRNAASVKVGTPSTKWGCLGLWDRRN